jgi:hypothetical protein
VRSHRAVRELRRGFGLGGSERKAPWWRTTRRARASAPARREVSSREACDETSPGFGPGTARSSPGGGSAPGGKRAKAPEPRKARPSGGSTRSGTRAKAPEPKRVRAPAWERTERKQSFGPASSKVNPRRAPPRGGPWLRPRPGSTPHRSARALRFRCPKGLVPGRQRSSAPSFGRIRREPEAQPSERSWQVTLPRARPRARLRPLQEPDGWPPRSHSEVGPKGRGGRPHPVLAPRADSPRTGRPRGRAPH